MRRGKLFIILCIVFMVSFSVTAEDEFVYNKAGKRDPFVPLIGATDVRTSETLEDILSIDDVKLEGVGVDSTGNSAAIINGEVIKEGETVGRLTVKKVFKDKLIVSINGEEHTLTVYEDITE